MEVFAHPLATRRATAVDLHLEACIGKKLYKHTTAWAAGGVLRRPVFFMALVVSPSTPLRLKG